jgi:hypothetical protein
MREEMRMTLERGFSTYGDMHAEDLLLFLPGRDIVIDIN